MSTEIRGVVTRATGSWYDVLHEGRTIACRIRGRIRLKGVRSTNPVVVGDEVVCTEGGDGEWVIERILPRRNYIIRRASNLSKESHIIAANIDQALLVATLSQPVTAPEFLDRFLGGHHRQSDDEFRHPEALGQRCGAVREKIRAGEDQPQPDNQQKNIQKRKFLILNFSFLIV